VVRRSVRFFSGDKKDRADEESNAKKKEAHRCQRKSIAGWRGEGVGEEKQTSEEKEEKREKSGDLEERFHALNFVIQSFSVQAENARCNGGVLIYAP
jgi:hypothetical protein